MNPANRPATDPTIMNHPTINTINHPTMSPEDPSP